MSELLPRELVWKDDGHVSDVAVTALADGQDAILPADAIEHTTSCEACARRVGETAMLSADMGEALARAPQPEPARLPWAAIGGGLAIAALGATPLLIDAPERISQATYAAKLGAPVAMRTLTAAAREGVGPMSTIATAIVLLVFGSIVARAARRTSLQKEVSR